jgi:tRNA pseudouridine55 synthase
LDGFLYIDKPCGLSSFDIVRKLRKALGIKKIGHSGTLDVEAEGLLIVAVGNATRLLPYVPAEPKHYSFTVQFGRTTDSLDRQGTIIDQGKPLPTRDILESVIPFFKGAILQRPPLFSAIKIKGQRAYNLARQNRNFDIPERPVTIFTLDLKEYFSEKGVADFTMSCSKGTYVRSLARDIAEKANTLGYALSIRRTAIAEVDISQAIAGEDINADCVNHLITSGQMFASRQSYTASQEEIERIAHGMTIIIETVPVSSLIFIYNNDGVLIAVTEHLSDMHYHPIKVFGIE